MKLPPRELREAFYWEIIQKCLASRNDRRAFYNTMRSYMLYGSGPDMPPADHNKVGAHMDQLAAFLFAADTTRFSIKLGAGVDKKTHLPRIPALVERLNDKWYDSDADMVFGNALLWALAFGTTLVKLIQRGRETMPFYVHPENFGVLREDVPMLTRQEAFVMCFFTTRDQLRRDLESHPEKNLILTRLSATRRDEGDLPAGVQRVITSSLHPLSQGNTMVGNVMNPLAAPDDIYVARTTEELVEGYELYVWNDDAEGPYNPMMGKNGDYQIITMIDPSICIYDRPLGRDMFVAGECPFVHVCPNPTPEYFWGMSEVAKVTRLQDKREHHLRQIDNLVDRNVNPPKAANGLWGAVDEKNAALQNLGVLVSTQDPVAKMQEFKPQIPTDLWQVVEKIDMQFDEASALNNVLKGRGDAGVRSKGQTDRLAQLGSARPKKRALIIEDSLERMAALYLRLDQKHNPEKLYTDEAQPIAFIAEQFTKDYSVKVDAHSSSPVFVEDHKNGAYAMFDRGIIDGEAVIDAEQPQNSQALKQRYRQMQAQRAQQEAQKQAKDGDGGAPNVVPIKAGER